MSRQHLHLPAAHSTCEPRELARSLVGNVCLCPQCDQVQLSLQYLSLRFETEAFRELVALLNQAERQLALHDAVH